MEPWWDDAVFYEIYPRSFQDSDGDGIGDLPGITRRLEHLQWLGVDSIWLAPIYESPNADFGYDVSDHAAISPQYGTDVDFAALVDEARARGLRVILDLVASHTSIQHPWFRAHPDRYVWSDGGPPNNWVASFGGPAWSVDQASGRWYLHSFFAEQPDLDWRNPDVREAMAGVVRHWLDRGVDGFRVDAVDRLMKARDLADDPVGERPFPLPIHPEGQHLDPIHSRDDAEIGTALATLRDAAAEAPLIGEVYLPAARHGPYREHLDAIFAFDLLHAPWEADAIAAVLAAVPPGGGELAWVASNHDFSRTATRWGEGAVRAAAMLLLTLPGPAFLYQGEEIGMRDGPGGSPPLDRYGRDRFRHPMQWTPEPSGGFSAGQPWLPPTDPGERNVQSQRRDPDSVLALYRRLIAVRKRLRGPIADVRSDGGLLSYRRGERHRILLNLGAEPRPAGALGAGAREESTHAEPTSGGALKPGAGLLLRTDG